MGRTQQRRRLLLLTLLVIAGFAALCVRLVDLQVVRCEKLRDEALKQHRRYYSKEPIRGQIRDIRGNLLASTERVKTVCADPLLLGKDKAAVAQVLAPLIEISPVELFQKFQIPGPRSTNGQVLPARYVVLRKKTPVEMWEKIDRALAWQFQHQLTNALLSKRMASKTDGSRRWWKVFSAPGKVRGLSYREQALYREVWRNAIFAEDDQKRVYPNQQLAAHVIGCTGQAQFETNGTLVTELVGSEGIELTFNAKLSGIRGWRLTASDARRHEVVGRRDQDVEPRPGLNVVLTLDSRVQQIVEEELVEPARKHSPRSVSAIVVRPATGEILAMASLPTFDPNNLGAYSLEARRNRLITEVAEPGSTFKIVTVAGALDDGSVKLTDTFNCEHGAFRYAGYTLHDHEAYDTLTVEEIVMKSSNIGTAKIAIERLGGPRLHHFVTGFGFGTRSGLPLNGESPGILSSVEKWKPIHVSRIPIGQGVAATTLQTVLAMAAIANGGTLMRPMLVDRLEDEYGNVVTQYRPQAVRRVINEATAKQMTAVLKTVTSEEGTAKKAMLEHYSVAGKTGTAQKLDDIVVQGRNGPRVTQVYSHTKYFASFIGYFPADKPQLCIGVMIDEPLKSTGYYGGAVAAPVFRRIAERIATYLAIPPDVPPEPEAVAAMPARKP